MLLLAPLVLICGKLLLTGVVRNLSEEEAETIPDNWTMSGPPMIIDYGWPWVFAERSDWLWDKSDYATFSLWPLIGDLIFLIAAVAFAGSLLFRHRRRHGKWLQLSLREMLAFVTLCACGLGWWTYHVHLTSRETQIENGILRHHAVLPHANYCGPDFLLRFTEGHNPESFVHIVGLNFPCGKDELSVPLFENRDAVKAMFRDLPYLRSVRFPSHYLEWLLNIPTENEKVTLNWNGRPTADEIDVSTPDPPWLDGIDLSAMSRIEKFEFCDASGPVTFEDYDSLTVLARLPRLRSLTISGGFVTRRGIDRLAHRGMLEHLELRYTNIDDDDVTRLSRLPDLRYLDLSGTKISDAALEHIAQVRSLTVLKILDCAITDHGILKLLKLPNLRYLALTGSPAISDEAIERLCKRIPSVSAENSK